MEKIIEGIQDCEKARILIEEWTASGNDGMIERLEKALAKFNFEELTARGATPALEEAKSVIAGFFEYDRE